MTQQTVKQKNTPALFHCASEKIMIGHWNAFQCWKPIPYFHFNPTVKLYKTVTLPKRNGTGDTDQVKSLLQEMMTRHMEGETQAAQWLGTWAAVQLMNGQSWRSSPLTISWTRHFTLPTNLAILTILLKSLFDEWKQMHLGNLHTTRYLVLAL